MRTLLVVFFTLFSLTLSASAQETEIEHLLQEREKWVDFQLQLISDIEHNLRVRNDARLEAYVKAVKAITSAYEDGKNISRSGGPLLVARVGIAGVKAGISLGRIHQELKFANAIDSHILDTVDQVDRLTSRIHGLNVQIERMYYAQAMAQVTLSTEANAISTYGIDDPESLDRSLISCFPDDFVKPLKIECPIDYIPLYPIGETCTCYVEANGPDSLAVEVAREALEDLKSGPMAMEDQQAEAIVDFCAENPLAFQCLPASKTTRLGAFCEGDNPLPDCNPNAGAKGTPGKRLGAFCQGQDPLPDCLE